MLSVCIPIYQYSVGPLVSELSEQASRLGIDVEIRCYDDGSSEADRLPNRRLAHLPGVVYRELPSNVGRAAIRNLLAREAVYHYLLFLDCDAHLPNDCFLAQYVSQLPSEAVWYGGRIYATNLPEDKRLRLHWYYGRLREEQPVEQRRNQPYHRFMTNNYLIPKHIQLRLPFEERLRHYGHEDTLFGLQLSRTGTPIQHFDNPVVHIGLEPDSVFLPKQRQAVHNLWMLHREGYPIESRLLTLFQRLERIGIEPGVYRLMSFVEPYLYRALRREPPVLYALDALKLLWLGSAKRAHRADHQ